MQLLFFFVFFLNIELQQKACRVNASKARAEQAAWKYVFVSIYICLLNLFHTVA